MYVGAEDITPFFYFITLLLHTHAVILFKLRQ
jgi:hypothetical protein